MRRPSDLYNWYCVFHSVASIARHATNIRIQQLSPRQALVPKCLKDTSQNITFDGDAGQKERADASQPTSQPVISIESEDGSASPKTVDTAVEFPRRIKQNEQSSSDLELEKKDADKFSREISKKITEENHDSLMPHEISKRNTEDAGSSVSSDNRTVPECNNDTPQTVPPLKSSKVPSSRLGRLFHYGSLAASLGYGAASELVRRGKDQDISHGSPLMSEANLNRLVSKLSQMRGAALKLGQFMSIQDSHVLPEDLERVFRRVQDSAHYMPNWQMEKVMESSLGPSWGLYFTSFNPVPSHAASIGQVHQAVLAPSHSPTGRNEDVAVKIQFPNIAQSIASDLGYVKLLLGAAFILPKGLFLDSTIKVFKEELADECNYRREADYITKYNNLPSLKDDNRYRVPWVWPGSTGDVLVMQRMRGISVGGDVVNKLSQSDRNEIAARILELCLRELFEFHMMQTDPNWSNFLWNSNTRQVELVDFGATREYSEDFIKNWFELLTAAISGDRDRCVSASLKLGYFVGGENELMIDAHIMSMQLLGTPFREDTSQPFSFSKGSKWAKITEEIRAQIPIMLNNRLTPPPRETYSLNRKLSGAFLLASRLGASIDCKSIWRRVLGRDASSLKA